jgi:hypothetical protein
MKIPLFASVALSAVLATASANAQTAANLNAFEGLAPVTALANTDAGKAALAANLAVTGAIQAGTAGQPMLLPFPEAQRQALRDGLSTVGNANQLADALGTKLGGVYRATATATSDNGRPHYTQISPAVADVLAYAHRTSNSDSAVSKSFFGNLTFDNATPVSAPAAAVMKKFNGTADMFGKAYNRPAGSAGAGAYGNARPFQTEPHLTVFSGKDFFDAPMESTAYLRGPNQDLTNSPSFPSGHTTYGYTEALVLALLVPARYPEMVARGAEYGNNRIVIGAHYTMDVLGGRTLAAYDLAQILARKPGYAGVDRGGLKIDDFQKALAAARADMTKALEAGCGDKIVVCAQGDQSRFKDAAKVRAFYESTQTYGLPVVFARNAGTVDIGKVAPEAGYLLTVAFPYLTLAQANAILTATEGPGGGFLDNGSAFGAYSRLNLYRAAEQARAAAPK